MLGSTGKYRLEQRLGGGGMAEVFTGQAVGAEGFARKVAIKRVLPGYSENPAFAQMFVAEAQISAQLQHPNIVSVVDFDRDADGRLFLVMELVDGKDLEALCATGLLPFAVVSFVMSEMLRGLGHAHDLPLAAGSAGAGSAGAGSAGAGAAGAGAAGASAAGALRGVVHRDVSPQNVLLSWEGAVKVSDFGIAKARAASEASGSVFIRGKPAYMSPEQANGEPLDGRSDLFAAGIMLWEMLVGRRLFTGEDIRATLAAVLFGQIARPRALRPEVPADLERVTMKLLERDLPARYATAEDAIADLLDCADAPKNGRELLVQILAQRFPAHAPVRAGRRGGVPTPPAPVQPVLANPALGSAPTIESLGAVRGAVTATLDPGRRRPHRARVRPLVFVGVLAALGVISFALVLAVARRGAPAIAPVVPPAGAAVAVITPRDAGISAAKPLDASVAATTPPDAKKDASFDHPVHAAALKAGRLAVKAFPVMTVTVDRKRIGETPLTITLPVGTHKVELTNAELGTDTTQTIMITESHTTTIDKTQ